MLIVSGTNEVEATKPANLFLSVETSVVEDTKIYLYCTNTDIILPSYVVIAKGDTVKSITYTPPLTSGFGGYSILAMYESYNTVFTVAEKEATTIALSSNPTVQGGSNLTLTLSLDASSNTDKTVYLEEQNLSEYPAVLTVPSVATIPTGDTSVTSTINTKTVRKNTPTVVVATYKGVKYYHNVIVTP